MTPPASSKWQTRLWRTILALALVIVAMVDVCKPVLLTVQVVIALVLFGAARRWPPPPKPVAAFKALLRSVPPLLVPMFLAVVAYANVTAIWASRGRIFTDVSQVPHTKVGLVFGTTDRVAGRENLYFRYRIDAATQLWNAGKVETLIVSGGKSSRYYDEPNKMKLALIERGIPADRIIPDEKGLRTLDSVVRAKEIFSTDSILFISQRFQNERAIYLATAHGIAAYGYAARDVETHAGLKTKIREVGARVKMWLDVNLLHTRPLNLGDKIELP